ncbi:MAG: nucleotidyltransferase family protein [Deltaproteobacteria bacterium]
MSTPMAQRELNRLLAELTSFEPASARPDVRGVDWGELCAIAIEQGLAAIVSYQLEYVWPGLGAPEPVREQLLSVYQGTLGDNVFKLVRLKEILSAKGMPELLLLSGAAAADAFYPHIAFRPIPELSALVRPGDRERAAQALAVAQLRPGRRQGRATPYSDGRLVLTLWDELPGLARSGGELAALFSRKAPARPYGQNAFRLAPEDALLAHVASLAEDGLIAPRIAWVELREMALRGARGASGFWDPAGGAPLRPALLRERSGALGLRRPLWAALELLCQLHPETEAVARALAPELPARRRALLRRLVVEPSLDPRRTRPLRGEATLRRALLRP